MPARNGAVDKEFVKVIVNKASFTRFYNYTAILVELSTTSIANLDEKDSIKFYSNSSNFNIANYNNREKRHAWRIVLTEMK